MANEFFGFKDGDEVEVTLKGRLSITPSIVYHDLSVYYVNGISLGLSNSAIQSVRLVEPDYERGEIYRSKLGVLYYRTQDDRWRWCDTGNIVDDDCPTRPLKKIS